MQCSHLLVVNSDDSFQESLKENLPESDFKISFMPLWEGDFEFPCLSCFDVGILVLNSPADVVHFEKIKSTDIRLPLIVLSQETDFDFVLKIFSMRAFAFQKKTPVFTELIELIKVALETLAEGDKLEIVSSSHSWIEIVIPAQSFYIARISSFWRSFITGFSEREGQRILYAFRELIQNAMEHGSCFSSSKKIHVRYLIGKRFILFDIEDEGEGFSMDSILHATAGPRKCSPMEVMQYRKQIGMRPGGLGISSVLNIADELIYSQKGNSVVMIKYKNPSHE